MYSSDIVIISDDYLVIYRKSFGKRAAGIGTMAYAFDGRALGQVLVETERLAEQSRDHERRLARLVQQLEGPSVPINSDLLLEIRHLCVNTRDQRQQLEAMQARLVGTPPEDHTLPASSGARVIVGSGTTRSSPRNRPTPRP